MKWYSERRAQHSPQNVQMLLDTGVQPDEKTLAVAAQYPPQLVTLFLEKGAKPTELTSYRVAR